MRMMADVARQRDVRFPAACGGVGKFPGVESEQLRKRPRLGLVRGALALLPRHDVDRRPGRCARPASRRPGPFRATPCAGCRRNRLRALTLSLLVRVPAPSGEPDATASGLKGATCPATTAPSHHRFGPGRPHRRRLCRPREPRAGRLRRRPIRRPADADDRGRELPRLPAGDHGARTDGGFPAAGRALRGGAALRRRHQGRFQRRAVPVVDRRRRVHRRHRDRRDRRERALARRSGRSALARPRRFDVRDLRRRVLPRQAHRRRRRRRLGDGRSAVPHALRQEGYRHPPALVVSRQQDHGRPRARARRRSRSSGTPKSTKCSARKKPRASACATSRPARRARSTPTRCSSRSVTIRTPRSSKASSTSIRWATSPRPTA